MRLVKLMILIIISLGMLGIVNAATFGNALPTNTTLSLSTKVERGVEVPISVSISDSGGNDVGVGDVSLHFLNVTNTLGSSEYTQSTTSVDLPRIRFSVPRDTTTDGFRIPMIGITDPTVDTTWKLYRTDLSGNSEIYAQGDLFRYDMESQISASQSIFILPSSYQGDGYTNPSTIDLSPLYIYDLVLDEGVTSKMYFTFPTTVVGSVEVYDDNSGAKTYISIDLMNEQVSTYAVSGAGISTSWTPTSSGNIWVLAYYTPPFIYGPSSDMVQVQVDDPATERLVTWNVTAAESLPFELVGLLTDPNSSIPGINVRFYLSIKNSWWALGENTTGADGRAIFSTLGLDTGTYDFYIEAHVNGKRLSANGKITVTPPQLILGGSDASMVYLDESASVTGTVVVNGTTNPVSSAVVELRRNGSLLQSTLTDVAGTFTFSQGESLMPGTYTDYYEIRVQKINYSSYSEFISLDVQKSSIDLQILVNSRTVAAIKFNEQPFTISGSAKINGMNARVDNVILQKSTGGGWSNISSMNILGTFSLNWNETVRDDYQYRLFFPGNATHLSATSPQVYLYMAVGDAVISRQGIDPLLGDLGTAADPIMVEYDKGEDIGVFIRDVNGIPISGATVVFYIPVNYTTSVITTQVNRTSGADGWVSLAFFPDRQLYQPANIGLLDILVEAYHQDYLINATVLVWRVAPTNIHITSILPSPRYNDVGSVVLTVVTDAGNPVEEGTSFNIEIGGETMVLSTNSSGLIEFSYTFLTVGNISLNVTHSSGYPYNNTSRIYSITVRKGLVSLSSTDITANAGETVTSTAVVRDSQGLLLSGLLLELRDAGGSVNSTTSVSGISQLSFNALYQIGDHDLTWTFAGNQYYESNSVSIVLSIAKILTSINVSGNSTVTYGVPNNLALILVDAWGSPIVGETLEISYGSYSWSVQTSSTTNLALPMNLSVGIHELRITYVGTVSYLSAESVSNITVKANTLTLQWVQNVESVSYYNESYSFSFYVLDNSGRAFSNRSVDVTIGSTVYTYITDSSGLIQFNEVIALNTGSYQVIIHAVYSGYDFPEQIINITHQKRILDVQSDLPTSSSLSVNQTLEMWIRVLNGNEGVEDVQVEVTFGTQKIVLFTNSTGYAKFSINFDQLIDAYGPLGAGDSFQLSVRFSHPSYEIPSSTYIFGVVPQDLLVSVEAGLRYNTPSNVTVRVTDDRGEPLSSLYLKVEDGSGFSLLLLTDGMGTIKFSYTPVGNDVRFTLLVLNADVRLNTSEFSFTVGKGLPIVEVSQGNIAEQSTIEVRVMTGSNPLDTPVELYAWISDQWQFLEVVNTTDGSALFTVVPYSQYRIVIPDTNLIQGSQNIFIPKFKYVTFSSPNVTAGVGQNVTVVVSGNSTIVGTIEVFTSVNGTRVSLGDVRLDEVGVLYTSTLQAGVYNVSLHYNGGPWLLRSNSSFLLNITQLSLLIEHNIEDLALNNSNSFDIRVSSGGVGVSGVSVILEVYDNGWQIIDSQISNSEGIVSFQIYVSVTGNLTLRIRTMQMSEYMASELILEVNVTVDTYMIIEGINQGTYSDGGNVTVLLLTTDGTPLDGEEIFVVLNSPNNSSVLGSAVTAVDGKAILLFPVDLKPNNYSIYIVYKGSAEYSSSQRMIDYTVSPEQLVIQIESDIDYGNGMNRTILVRMTDNDNNPLSGLINWVVLDAENQPVISGSVSVTDGYGRIVLTDLYGEYSLTIIPHSNSFYTAMNTQSVNVGWPLVSTISTPDVTVSYPDYASIVIGVNGTDNNPVENAVVRIYVLNGTEIVMELDGKTNSTGVLSTQLETSILVPGNYSILIYASNDPTSSPVEYRVALTVEKGVLNIDMDFQDFVYSEAQPPVIYGIPENSTLIFQIVQDHRIIYSGDDPSVLLDSLDAGNYSMVVEVKNQNYYSLILSKEFTVSPKRINFNVSYSLDEGYLNLLIEAPVEGVSYQITITQDGVTSSFFTSNSTLSLLITSDVELLVEATGNYAGVTTLTVPYSSSSPSIPVMEIVILTAIGSLSVLEQKRKIMSTLFGRFNK